jgi:hypothetical protein
MMGINDQSQTMTGLDLSMPILLEDSTNMMDGSMIDCFQEMSNQLNQKSPNQSSVNFNPLKDSLIATSMINPMFTNDYRTLNVHASQQFVQPSHGQDGDGEEQSNLDQSLLRKIR